MENNTKQNAKQRYYEKNKELYKERVRKQREEKKMRKQPIIESNPADSIEQTVDFIAWIKRMTYICVDIKDI